MRKDIFFLEGQLVFLVFEKGKVEIDKRYIRKYSE